MRSNLLQSLIEELCNNDCEFILVGGMAAVLHGAPVVTQDLDIVHRRSPENIQKVAATLSKLNARYRGDPRRLGPTELELSGNGHLSLSTDLGPLDVLCELTPGVGFDDLIDHTVKFSLGNVSFRVLTLPKLIETKKAAGRAKDMLALPILLATLDEAETD